MSLDNIDKKEKRRKVFFFIRISFVSFLYLLSLLLSLFLGFDFIGGLVFKNYIRGVSFILLSTLGLILFLVYLFIEVDKILSPLDEEKAKRTRLKIFFKKAKNLLFRLFYKKEK